MHLNPEIIREQQPFEVPIPEIWAEKADLYISLWNFLSVLGYTTPDMKIDDIVYALKKEHGFFIENVDAEQTKKAFLAYFFKNKDLNHDVTFIADRHTIEIEFGFIKKSKLRIKAIQIIENGQDLTKETQQFVLEAFSLKMDQSQSNHLSELLSKMYPNQVLNANFVNRHEQPVILDLEEKNGDYHFGEENDTSYIEDNNQYQSNQINNENEMPLIVLLAVIAIISSLTGILIANYDEADLATMLACAIIPPTVCFALFGFYSFKNNQVVK